VYSTGYKRTQLSAQALLDGLRAGTGGTAVRVRSSSQEFLNNFETRNQEMLQLVADASTHTMHYLGKQSHSMLRYV
jgi:hypothetical protein